MQMYEFEGSEISTDNDEFTDSKMLADFILTLIIAWLFAHYYESFPISVVICRKQKNTASREQMTTNCCLVIAPFQVVSRLLSQQNYQLFYVTLGFLPDG